MYKPKIICTGNPEEGVAQAIAERWPETQFVSRTDWGYDLTQNSYKDKLAEKALNYDVFINCSALWQYHQTLLLDVVYKHALKNLKRLHIVSLGSTTDRATKGSDWHYQQEKKALRSTSNALGLKSIWQGGPKVSYVTFGTLQNNAHKHPGRAVMQLTDAVDMIEYVINMPYNLNVNELSIDPIQTEWPVLGEGGPKSKFCHMPWHGITLSADGDVKPCCQFSNKGRQPNTEHDTIMENFNSERMQDLRKQFLNGEQPSACNSCWEREDLVGQSRRLWFNKKFMKFDADFKKGITPTEISVPSPKFYQADINLSNVCNLKCRMCGSWASNSWFEEELALAKIDKRYEKNSNPVPLQQYGLEDLRNMLPHLKDVKRIDFKGGEPMMAKHHNQFLQWLIDEDMTDIELFYTTNGTVQNPKILNLLSHFKRVSICFSIEGTGKLYSYIRGGKYQIEDFEKTLAVYDKLENVQIMFNVTLQNYNVFNLPDLYLYLHDLEDRYNRVDANSAFTTICNKPAYLSPLNLPDDLRDLAIENLSLFSDFDNLVESMKNRKFEPELWEVFINFTNDLDKMRDDNVIDAVPELKDHF